MAMDQNDQRRQVKTGADRFRNMSREEIEQLAKNGDEEAQRFLDRLRRFVWEPGDLQPVDKNTPPDNAPAAPSSGRPEDSQRSY